jgi:hypothetical protein
LASGSLDPHHDIRLQPVDGSLFKSISSGQFANRELYHLRLQAEHAQLASGFDELVSLGK